MVTGSYRRRTKQMYGRRGRARRIIQKEREREGVLVQFPCLSQSSGFLDDSLILENQTGPRTLE